MKTLNETEYNNWKRNNEPKPDDGWGDYGMAVFRFAERWADLMEPLIEDGKPIAEFAEALSHEANTEGITRYQYGRAVSILAKCWIYGEILRRWSNKDLPKLNEGDAANDSGGVLNPALLSISIGS